MGNIKYGICEWSLPWKGHQFAFDFASELGFDGMMVDLGFYENDLPMGKKRIQDAYMNASEKYGIELPSMCVTTVNDEYTMNSTPGLYDFYMACNALKTAVDSAAAMGIKILMPPHFYQNVIRNEEDLKHAAMAYREVCPYAAVKVITFASENALTKEEWLRFRDYAGNPENLKIFFDTQNYWKHKGYNVARMYNDLKEFTVPVLQ